MPMKSRGFKFDLLTIVLLPSLVVGSNLIALTWSRNASWTTYGVQPSFSPEEVRMVGWPVSFVKLYPGRLTQDIHWPVLVFDCLVATIMCFCVFGVVWNIVKLCKPT